MLVEKINYAISNIVCYTFIHLEMKKGSWTIWYQKKKMPFKLKKHLCERFESCTTQSHISLANVCQNKIVYTECLHLGPTCDAGSPTDNSEEKFSELKV